MRSAASCSASVGRMITASTRSLRMADSRLTMRRLTTQMVAAAATASTRGASCAAPTAMYASRLLGRSKTAKTTPAPASTPSAMNRPAAAVPACGGRSSVCARTTPLQVARWFSAIANNGLLPRPSLVHETGLIGEARTIVNVPVSTPTGLRPEVIATIQEGLCAVTLPGGTADFVFSNSALQTIGVCGKTGTAQTGGPGTPPHAWFASYAPRENPEVVVVVLMETAGQGSEVAAPIARQVLEAYFGME